MLQCCESKEYDLCFTEDADWLLKKNVWVIHWLFSLTTFEFILGRRMATLAPTPAVSTVNPREKALEDFRKKIMEHKEIEARLKQSIEPKNIKFNHWFIFIFSAGRPSYINQRLW
jgi:hypothetical protein